MLIDLRNTVYYKSKLFSLKETIFGSKRPDLTDEEKEQITNLNLASALGGISTATGAFSYYAGAKMKEFQEKAKKKYIEDRVKAGKNPIPGPVPITDGKAMRGFGLLLMGTGVPAIVVPQIMKKVKLDKKDKGEKKEKSFAATPMPLTKSASRIRANAANIKKPVNQPQQNRAATTQQVTQREVQKAQFIQKNEGMRAQRLAQKIQASQASMGTRKAIAAQKTSDIQSTNLLRAKELEQRRISQTSNVLARPNLNNRPPIVPMKY